MNAFWSIITKFIPSKQQQPQNNQLIDQSLSNDYLDLLLLLKEYSSNQEEFSQNEQQVLNYFQIIKESSSINDETQQQKKSQKEELENNLIERINLNVEETFLQNQMEYLDDNNHQNQIIFHRLIENIKQIQQKSIVTHINTDNQKYSEKQSIKEFIDEISKLTDSDDFQIQILKQFIISFQSTLVDLIYRRIPLNSFIKSMIDSIKDERLNILSRININDIITSIFEMIDLFEKINLGSILSSQYQSIPIFYPLCRQKDIYKQNIISAFSTLNESSQKHLILNINTSNIDQTTREQFFTYLFNCKDYISDFNDGINKLGTINLYTNFPNRTLNNTILIDIAILDLKSESFVNILSKILENSSIVFLHVNCQKDFSKSQNPTIPSIEMNKILKQLQKQCSQSLIKIIFHKNKQKSQQQILNNFIHQKFQNMNSQQLEIIYQTKNDQEYVYKNIFNSLKQSYFSKENKINLIENLMNHFLNDQNEIELQQFHLQNFKSEIEKQIQKALQDKSMNSQKEHQLIQTMFPVSNSHSQIYYKQKIFQNFTRLNSNSEDGIKKRQEKEEKIIKLNQSLKEIQKIPEITSFFFNQITTTNQITQIICSQLFSIWKQPLVIENNNKIIQIKEQIINLEKQINEQQYKKDHSNYKALDKLYKQKNKYLILHDNYDVSIESFVREICLFYENKNYLQNKLFNQSQITQFNDLSKKYYKYSFNHGIPIQFIDKTRKFGSGILKQFIKSIDKQLQYENQNYIIISVIGPQSTAKSTLLNYLFRCNFETSSARCTKGMYFTKITFEGINLLVIDTEGLLSSVYRESQFDNSVMALLFIISHVIIFNIKDESNSNMKEMMSITTEIMKLFTSETTKNYTKPEIFIVLRDFCDSKQVEEKKKLVATEISQMSSIFDKSYTKVSNKMQIDLQQENIFIFQSAFSNSNKFEEPFQQINSQFGIDILGLRKAIREKIEKKEGYYTLIEFYEKGERVWERLMKNGHELLKCVTLQEYQSKKKLEHKATNILIEEVKNYEQKIIEKQDEIKYQIELRKIQNKREEIKQQYELFCQSMIDDINEQLENKLLTFYQSEKQISQISTKEFDLIVQKIQHRNFTSVQNSKYEFNNRIDYYFYIASIEQIVIDFHKQIQLEISGGQICKDNEQPLKKLLIEMQETYKKKINETCRQFDIQELLRTQLESIKSNLKNIENKEIKYFIQQIQICYFNNQMKNTHQEQEVNQIEQNFIIKNNDFLKSQSSEQEIISLAQKFKDKINQDGYLEIPKENNDLMRFILDETNKEYSEFYQIVKQKSKYLNTFQIYKYFFIIIYQKTYITKQLEIYNTLINITQTFEKKIQEKLVYIEDILHNSKDWVSRGEKALNRIQSILIDAFVERSVSKLDSKINNDVCKLVQNHTSALEKAFSSVYIKDNTQIQINIDNFLKYTLDINRYVDEMKRNQIEDIINIYVDDKQLEFKFQISNIFKNLKNIIQDFSHKEDFTFQSLIDKLNEISYENKSFDIGSEIIFDNKDSSEKYIEVSEEQEDIQNKEEPQQFDEINVDISQISKKKEEEQNSEIFGCNDASINLIIEELKENNEEKDNIATNNQSCEKIKDQNDVQLIENNEETNNNQDQNINNYEQKNNENQQESFDDKQNNTTNKQSLNETQLYNLNNVINSPEDDILVSSNQNEEKKRKVEIEEIKQSQNSQTQLSQLSNSKQIYKDEIEKDTSFKDISNLNQSQLYENEKSKIKKKIVKKQFHISKNFLRGMQNQTNQKEGGIGFIIEQMETKFKEKLKEQFNEARKKYYEEMIGCQERCPICGMKCHLQKGHLDNHDVKDRHFISGMQGTIKGEKLLCNDSCLETLGQPYRIHFKLYADIHDVCQKLYPEWTSCFEKQSFERDNEFDQVIKIGYSLTAKWFLNFYKQDREKFSQYIVDLPEHILELQKGQEVIEDSYQIKWKYDEQDKVKSDQSLTKEELFYILGLIDQATFKFFNHFLSRLNEQK